VRCSPGQREAEVNYQNRGRPRRRKRPQGPHSGFTSVVVTSKFGSRKGKRRVMTTGAEEEDEPRPETEVDVETPLLVGPLSDRDEDDDISPSGWMELKWPPEEEATIEIKLKSGGPELDVALGRCTASLRGDGSAIVALTDDSGCSAANALPRGLQVAQNEQTGVKVFKGQLRLPRASIGRRARLSARCQARVCQGPCQSTCGKEADNGPLVETFTVAAHVDVEPAAQAEQDHEVRPSHLVENPSLAVEQLRRPSPSYEQPEQNPSMLCVSSASVALSFALLVLVLLLALAFACALWMRARMGPAGKFIQRGPAPLPVKHPLRPLPAPPVLLPRATPGHSMPPPPYIRVLH